MTQIPLARAHAFAECYGLRAPVLMAPMAGACPPALAGAVANGGGMGAAGVLLMNAEQIAEWVAQTRRLSNGAFQLNTWIPDPEPARDAAAEQRQADFLSRFGPEVDPTQPAPPQPFDAQCTAMIAAGPRVMTSIMGLYPDPVIEQMKARGIAWFATVTTVSEARAAVDAGADAVIAQGFEAGGHRGAFVADTAEAQSVGLFSLIPAVVEAVDVPVIATGGIADARGLAAALVLGASGVQIGTALLRSPEAGVSPAWAAALAESSPENTALTRAFSGRAGRAIRNAYVAATQKPTAPAPAPYPVQRALTGPMRNAASKAANIDSLQAWAGQSAHLSQAKPAAQIVEEMWQGACDLLT